PVSHCRVPHGACPQVSTLDPETVLMPHFRPAAQICVPPGTMAQRWPSPGGRTHVPALKADVVTLQMRSPWQVTTGSAERSHGLPSGACTIVVAAAQTPMVRWQKLPARHAPTPGPHGCPTSATAWHVLQAVVPLGHEEEAHWLGKAHDSPPCRLPPR